MINAQLNICRVDEEKECRYCNMELINGKCVNCHICIKCGD